MDRTEENLKRIRMYSRVTDTKGYPDDKDPNHWKTINGSHVHLDGNGNYDGGAAGKFNTHHHWGPGWKEKNQSVSKILGVLGNLGKQKQALEPKKPSPAPANNPLTGNQPGAALSNLAKATQPKIAIAIKPTSMLGTALAKLDKAHGASYTKDIDSALQAAPKEFQAMWETYADGMQLNNGSWSGTPFYSPSTNGVSISMKKAKAGVDKNKKPYQVFFHEFGHHIDELANRISVNYNNGIFDKTIRAEVKAKVDAEYAKVKAEHPDWDKKYIYKCAKNNVSAQLFNLPDYQRNCLSDIFGGATRNQVLDGWKHKLSYWNDKQKLAVESFAHFCETMAANPEGYAVMKQWLPKSEKVFQEMIAEISKKQA